MAMTSFASLLKDGRPDLYGHLEQMRSRAFEDWIHLLQPEAGSHAGYIHLSNVERNADKMIPEAAKKEFSHGEIFLLLSSILLHDVGRIVPDQVVRTCPASGSWECDRLVEKGAEPCPLAGGPPRCQDTARWTKRQGTHGCLSKSLIDSLWPVFGIPDGQIAEYCGLVSLWHQLKTPPGEHSGCALVGESAGRFEDTSLEPYGPFRLPLLAAILRIADETENCWTRAIRQHWYDVLIKSGQDANDMGKAFRRGISDVEFCPDGECIIMHVPQLDPLGQKLGAEDETRIMENAQGTEDVLAAWGRYLDQAHVAYKRVFIHSNRRLLNPRPADPQCMSGVLEKGDYLPQGTLRRYFDAILRLARGTCHHEEFSWGAIEGVIHETLKPKTKWLILRMGAAHDAFRVFADEVKGTVTVKVNYENVGDAEIEILGPGAA